ncbi:MAG: nuclease, partial [Erythrobacter sp.]|nr:nuclease [Erythrobacter sp.]
MKEGGMAGRSPENNVFDFRAGVSRQKQGKLRGLALLVAGGLLVGILAGVLGIYWPFGSASAEARTTHSFAV